MSDREIELLHAFADGELNPSQAAALEHDLAADAALRARYESILALRKRIRALPEEEVPLERLMAKARPRAQNHPWRQIAAAALLAAVLSGAATFFGLRYDTGQKEIATFAVANHVRGLLATQPFDVASSDRHTIKPWFTTKLPESPPVVDLAGDGFSLAGGRVDVVLREPVPTLVYRHGPHAISLTMLRGERPVADRTMDGYNVKAWREGDFTFVAVSDIPVSDLEAFARAFRRGVSQLK